MNGVYGMAKVTCGWCVVEEQQELGYEIITDYYLKKKWGVQGAGRGSGTGGGSTEKAFIHEVEHDHIQFQACNQRQSEVWSGEEEAINRKVSQLGGCCQDPPKNTEGLYRSSGGLMKKCGQIQER